MAEKVKKTDTKEKIFAAYQEALKKIKEKEAMVVDPYADQKKQEAERIEKSAADFIESGFVSPEVVQKYNDLKESIAQKEAILKELYDIEAEGAKVAAMHNTYKVTKIELDEQAKADADARRAEKAELDAQIKAEIKEAQANLAKTKKDLDAEEKAYKKDLDQARAREAEEYKYNLNRSRSKENDAWEDEKAQREKILAQKEADLAERLASVAEREKSMADLEAKVEAFPKKLEEATEAGKAAGKAEADKSHAFEKRAMEKSAEYEKNLLQAKVDAQTTLIASQDAKIKELETKLDAAYTRNQELATTVAKNSGSTTIVQSSDTDNRSKK